VQVQLQLQVEVHQIEMNYGRRQTDAEPSHTIGKTLDTTWSSSKRNNLEDKHDEDENDLHHHLGTSYTVENFALTIDFVPRCCD